MFYLNSTNKKSAVEGSLVSLSLIDKRNLLWLLFSIVNKVFRLRLSSFINVVVNGEICLNSEFTDISFLLFMAKTKKGFVSASSPHFKKKQKTLQLCFFSAWMKRHISVFKTWFLLLANSCLKSRYSVVKCGQFKHCLLPQDMLLTSVRLWSTPIKTHNFNSSWINSLNRVCVFTFNAALLGSIRRACCAAQASCYWFDYDGQSDIQFTRYQATTLSNLKRIYFNYLESRVWWKK